MSELYQLPDGWEWKKLSDVCDSMQGIQLPKVEQICELREGYVRYLYISDFTTDKNIIYVVDQYKNKIVNEHEYVIVNTGATAGKIFHGKRGVLSNNLFKVSNFKNINDRYFYFYYLVLYQNIISNELKQSTQPHLGHKAFNGYDIPLPPIPEQKRIVQKLDALFERVDKAIALLQKNIAAANNFMNSVLNDVFSDLEQNYGTQTILDGVNIGARAGYKPCLIGGKVPFIGMSDIDDESGINTKYVLEDYEKVSKGKVKFEKNAVLVGKITPCTQNNKTTIVPAEIDGGFATTEVYALHSKENMYPFYLNYFMRSKNVNDYLVSTMVGATGRQRVPSESIRALNISIPPIFIQEKAVLYFDNVSAQISQIKSSQQKKMQNLLSLKSSILDQAFHGKL